MHKKQPFDFKELETQPRKFRDQSNAQGYETGLYVQWRLRHSISDGKESLSCRSFQDFRVSGT